MLPSFFVLTSIQNSNHADASTSLGDSIQQFQNNLQSDINKEIQSSSNNNNNNCDSNNNISVQSQTNNNGQSTSTSKSTCGDSTQFSSSSSSGNGTLYGAIVSSEYDIQEGIIINSIFGNWSLSSNGSGFYASFTKQPLSFNQTNEVVFPDSNNNILNTNNISPGSTNIGGNSNTSLPPEPNNNQTQTGSASPTQLNSNTTSYNLSNFKLTSVNTINFDKTYQGEIDVIQEITSLNNNRPDESNSFKDVGVSISILGDRILSLNFVNQTTLFNEFKNIPLVGIVQ
ncbi:MAG: hypothetical protein H0X03_06260 [Nitrosopumilus sp.]|nr:hypothetical protein [Nitrosopumilus sp.]